MGMRTLASVVVAAVVTAVGGGAWIGPPGGGPGASATSTPLDASVGDSRSDRGAVPGLRAGEVPAAEALSRRYVPAEVPEGSGTFTTVAGTSEPVGRGWPRTFAVEVEDGLGVEAERFADEVQRILLDPRGWTADGTVALRRVDTDQADLRVTLASPATVDAECRPLETGGRFSCWNGERAMLNVWRWRHGASAFGDDLTGYRGYLVSHEVGHALGRGHVGCPAPGVPAPVMMQQTVGVEPCAPNPWPYPYAGG